MSALHFLETLAAACFPGHIPVALLRVESYLRANGYDPQRVRGAIDYIDAHGTARGCAEVDGEDLAAVERLIPEHVRRDHDCFPECECCRDETDYRRGLLWPTGPCKAVDDSDLAKREAF